MSLIGQITFINQNSHIPSIIAAENVAREKFSKDVQKVMNEEKEIKIREVRPVEESEKILAEDSKKREIEQEAKNHIDLKV
ncbi:MAG TPA: hypothetical protein EYH54_03125 [Nautiliaceae bacterium]|nr:hypothetical protein [Nautiliaceae bacterium]